MGFPRKGAKSNVLSCIRSLGLHGVPDLIKRICSQTPQAKKNGLGFLFSKLLFGFLKLGSLWFRLVVASATVDDYQAGIVGNLPQISQRFICSKICCLGRSSNRRMPFSKHQLASPGMTNFRSQPQTHELQVNSFFPY